MAERSSWHINCLGAVWSVAYFVPPGQAKLAALADSASAGPVCTSTGPTALRCSST